MTAGYTQGGFTQVTHGKKANCVKPPFSTISLGEFPQGGYTQFHTVRVRFGVRRFHTHTLKGVGCVLCVTPSKYLGACQPGG
jgi:hypothetical protein